MARIGDALGRFMDLRPLRYEFDNLQERQALAAAWNASRAPGNPRRVVNEDDANYLIAQLTASDGEEPWSVAFPFLRVQDLRRQAEWLRSRADARPGIRP